MLNSLVEASLRYKFLVLIAFGVIAFLGWRAIFSVPICLSGGHAGAGEYLHRIAWSRGRGRRAVTHVSD